jgi:tetratricopeptide (TPR) repeat protein
VTLRLLIAALLTAAVFAQRPDAVTFHEQRVQARPGDNDALRLLADALVARAEVTASGEDYERASQLLDQAERREPWFEPILLSRCRLLLSRHRFLAARALAEEALRHFPRQMAFLEIAGDGALETGDLDGAEQHYLKLLKARQQMSSWARLAHVYELREQWDKAHEYQSKALEATFAAPPAPMESRAWCRAILGEIELKRGKPAAAREQYRQGLTESPDHPLVLEHLAELELIEGNAAAAVDAYGRVLKKQRNPVLEMRLADLLEKAGRDGEAREIRNKALEFMERAVSSGNEGFLRPLAEGRLREKLYQEAAALQVRDVLLRPTADACEVLQRIERSAAGAGKPLKETGLGICGKGAPEFSKPLLTNPSTPRPQR